MEIILPIPLEKGAISINAMSGGSICRQGRPEAHHLFGDRCLSWPAQHHQNSMLLLNLNNSEAIAILILSKTVLINISSNLFTQRESLPHWWTAGPKGTHRYPPGSALPGWGHLVTLKLSFRPPLLSNYWPKMIGVKMLVLIMQAPGNQRRRSTCQARRRLHRSDTEQGIEARKSSPNLWRWLW